MLQNDGRSDLWGQHRYVNRAFDPRILTIATATFKIVTFPYSNHLCHNQLVADEADFWLPSVGCHGKYPNVKAISLGPSSGGGSHYRIFNA
ncbi:hypothetical protein TNCV_2834681 [Trichonephila clavipes]|nr:hypothetical protein TNCV_2834681 [Trichonephila clavipes]